MGHDFDWRQSNLKTPSGHLGTGPSFDHTKGAGNSGTKIFVRATNIFCCFNKYFYSQQKSFVRVTNNLL